MPFNIRYRISYPLSGYLTDIYINDAGVNSPEARRAGSGVGINTEEMKCRDTSDIKLDAGASPEKDSLIFLAVTAIGQP